MRALFDDGRFSRRSKSCNSCVGVRTMASLWARGSVAVLLLVGVPLCGHAQAKVQVARDTPACGACGVSVRTVTVLEHPEWNVSEFTSVAGRVGKGFFVAPLGPTIYAFDSSGRFQRTLGRAGQGPGEFQFIRTLLLNAGDSLLAFDELRRYSMFAPNGRHVRTHSLLYTPTSAMAFGDGRMALAAPGRRRADAGLPLHLTSSTGQHLRSFGAVEPILDPDRPAMGYRVVAAVNDGTIWTAMIDRYVLEHWDSTGKLLQRIERHAPWFPEPQKARGHLTNAEGATRRYKLDAPPAPFVRGIEVDMAGRVWVLSGVADPQWASNNIWLGEGEAMTSTKMNAMYDSILEEVDPPSGTVLSSLRLPQYVHSLIGRGTLAAIVDHSSGERVVRILGFGRFPSNSRRTQ